MPWEARYSTMACVVAAMCALNAVSRLGPAMSGGAENHLLVGIAGVRDEVVIRADYCVDVDEVFRKSRLAGARVSHGPHSAVDSRVSSGLGNTFSPSVAIVSGLIASLRSPKHRAVNPPT